MYSLRYLTFLAVLLACLAQVLANPTPHGDGQDNNRKPSPGNNVDGTRDNGSNGDRGNAQGQTDPDCDKKKDQNAGGGRGEVGGNNRDVAQGDTSKQETGADGVVTTTVTQIRTQIENVVSTVTVTVPADCSTGVAAQPILSGDAAGSQTSSSGTTTTPSAGAAGTNGASAPARVFLTDSIQLGLTSLPAAEAATLGASNAGNMPGASTLSSSSTVTTTSTAAAGANGAKETAGATLTEDGIVPGLTSIPVASGA